MLQRCPSNRRYNADIDDSGLADKQIGVVNVTAYFVASPRPSKTPDPCVTYWPTDRENPTFVRIYGIVTVTWFDAVLCTPLESTDITS